MAKALNIAFIWHMHQPYYKDQISDTYELPWVRLHAIKDYYDMVSILKNYPKVHQTFNIVPSLLEQISEYAEGTVRDKYLHYSMKHPNELTSKEKIFILKRFCNLAWEKRVAKYPRYWELIKKREELFCALGAPRAAAKFTEDEYRDIQVWFNLSWFDPMWIEKFPDLKKIVEKGRDFSEKDKYCVTEKQFEVIRKIIPLYKEMQERGQIEITTSPYYHPILPLLVDVSSARIAVPDIELPPVPFAFPEDAKKQIEDGLDAYLKYFGTKPWGMWTPEQAVGENILAMLAQEGINWIISDEEVLARSLERQIPRNEQRAVLEPEVLYKPYLIEKDSFKETIVFRDLVLSNLIAFVYGSRPAQEAVADFIERLEQIWNMVKERNDDFLVTVALDGENCWEYYQNDGHDFLHLLYEQLSEKEYFNLVTVSEYLSRQTKLNQLSKLHTGSWINGNFRTWIGSPAHSSAWNYLLKARNMLLEYQAAHPQGKKELIQKAWKEIYIAEGSDWFWWLSNLHDSGMDEIWDSLFRLHLRAVYELLGRPSPLYLYYPLLEKAALSPVTPPLGKLCPRIDGKETARDEWALAGRYDFAPTLGTISRETGLQRIYYGYDEENLFLRIDGVFQLLKQEKSNIWLELCFFGPRKTGPNSYLGQLGTDISELGLTHELKITFEGNQAKVTLSEVRNESWIDKREIHNVMVGDNLEMAVPFAELGLKAGDLLNFVLILVKDELCYERAPKEGLFSIRVPEEIELEIQPRGNTVLMASSEVVPFAKTGGLADVAGSLPRVLREQGMEARIIMPKYAQVQGDSLGSAITSLSVPMGEHSEEAIVYSGSSKGDIPVYFVGNDKYFNRENLYGYQDDAERFIFFCRAVLEILKKINWQPNIIHCNDWHTGLIPNYLATLYQEDPFFVQTATVFSIHNLSYKGICSFQSLKLAGLGEYGLVYPPIIEQAERIMLIARGIAFADVVNTVSGRYALEIQTPQFGEGLDPLLREQREKLFGILNGIDYQEYDPATDKNIVFNYDASALNKVPNKVSLQKECGLTIDPETPLVGIISRLTDQKGFDIMIKLIDPIMNQPLQLVLLGTGDQRYHEVFERVKQRYPTKAAVFLTFDNALAHRIYAGSDMFLMPSNFEPCGLGQLISLRYGTIPIVRSTGGLADTVKDFNPLTNEGSGFVFDVSGVYQRRSMDKAAALFVAIIRALETYKNKEIWQSLMKRAMQLDNSWGNSARKYELLYQKAQQEKRFKHCKTKVYDLGG